MVQVKNTDDASIALSDLDDLATGSRPTSRRWISDEQVRLFVDHRRMRQRHKDVRRWHRARSADHYLELGFLAAAGGIALNVTSGNVQIRICSGAILRPHDADRRLLLRPPTPPSCLLSGHRVPRRRARLGNRALTGHEDELPRPCGTKLRIDSRPGRTLRRTSAYGQLRRSIPGRIPRRPDQPDLASRGLPPCADAPPPRPSVPCGRPDSPRATPGTPQHAVTRPGPSQVAAM